MNARRAARELALLTLFQLEERTAREKTSWDRIDLKDMILASVRTLVTEARSKIQTAADELADVSRWLLDYESDHPTNLATPIEAPNQPVKIPTTRDMAERIERCLQGAEFLFEALRLPELSALSGRDEVQNYAVKLIQLAKTHEQEIDELLSQHSTDWRPERLIKMDRYILRLAVAEMKYVENVDPGVSINEAIELAKEYSTEESYRFINGVLGGIANVLEGKPADAPRSEEKPARFSR